MSEIDISNISGQNMRVFLAVYDEVSVSKAALTLGLSQSAVSHSLERLRGILGGELFQKSGRGIAATALAERVAGVFRSVIVDLESLGESDSYVPELDQSPFAVAVNGSAMALATRHILAPLWAQRPLRELCLRELGSRDNLEDCLLRAEADLAIVPRLNTYAMTLRHQQLFVARSLIFYDPRQRGPVRSIEDYGAARHAVLDFGGRTMSKVEQSLEQWAINRQICLRVPNVWQMADALRGSDLIATLPETLGQGPLADLASCPPPFAKSPISFDLVWHIQQENSRRNQWFRVLLAENFAPVRRMCTAGQLG